MKGWFWGYESIEAQNVSCVSFQGHFKKLLPILTKDSSKSGKVVMIDRGEIPLHDDYGGVDYWKVNIVLFFTSVISSSLARYLFLFFDAIISFVLNYRTIFLRPMFYFYACSRSHKMKLIWLLKYLFVPSAGSTEHALFESSLFLGK